MVSALDEKQMKHWESLLDRQDRGSNLESARRDIETAVFAGLYDQVHSYTILIHSSYTFRAQFLHKSYIVLT